MSTVLVVSNPAPRGPAGKTILSGTGAPTPAIGTNGDFYFDTAASKFYGPKTAGVWPPPIDLGGVTYATQTEVDEGTENAKAVSPETYQQGITNRIATQTEAEEGTNPLKLMTPERVKQAILANPGGVTYATQVEVDAGTETAKAINPLTYQQGITNRLASQAEAEAGTDNTKLMTPLRVAEAIATLANNLTKATTPQAEAGVDDTAYMTPLKTAQAIAALGQQLVIATQSEAETGTDNIKYMTPLRVAQAISALANVPEFATQVETDAGTESNKTISPATFQQGVTNRLASQAEAEAGTDATRLMTPQRVAQAIAALGQQLVLATQAEAEAGTDNSKYMTPLRVAQAIAALASSVSFASQAEVDAGTETAKAVSPATMQQGITNRIATQAEAEAGTDSTKLMTPERVAQAIAALASGAYPANVTVLTANTTLTAAHQGIVTAGVAGITITLPASAVNGQIYEFVHGGLDFEITHSGNIIGRSQNPLKIVANERITLLAYNSPGLLWFVLSPRDAGAWDTNKAYQVGEIVSYGGDMYVAKSPSTGSQPDTSPADWVKVGGATQFIGLSDSPGTYVGQAGKVPAVNAAETALEFISPPGGWEVVTLNVSGTMNDVAIGSAPLTLCQVTGSGVISGIQAPASGSRMIVFMSNTPSVTLQNNGGTPPNQVFSIHGKDTALYDIPIVVQYRPGSAQWSVSTPNLYDLNNTFSPSLVTVVGGTNGTGAFARLVVVRATNSVGGVSGYINFANAGSGNTRVDINLSSFLGSNLPTAAYTRLHGVATLESGGITTPCFCELSNGVIRVYTNGATWNTINFELYGRVL